MSFRKDKMPETWYRSSRCCRVLGNPTAYLIIKCLGEGQKTPTDLAQALGVTLSSISVTLRHLREVDLVRYLTEGSSKVYWLKDRNILRGLSLIEQFVETMRTRED